MTTDELRTQLVIRLGHGPSCGEGAEFPWDCTCDYGGVLERLGVALDVVDAARAAHDGLAELGETGETVAEFIGLEDVLDALRDALSRLDGAS